MQTYLVDTEIINFQSKIYDFFANSYGTVDTIHSEFDKKYINSSKNELKKTLKHLKLLKPSPLQEIKYISRFLRNCYRKKENEVLTINQLTNRTFGNTAKNYLSRVKIELNQTLMNKTVITISKKLCQKKTNRKNTAFLHGCKKRDIPSIGFHLEAPTYKEITKINFKMKSSASPCPLDQVSIIVLKKCTYLRTYLWRIISASWARGDFSTVWKRGITVLAYKKDSNKDPSNFRPITLQPVL